MARKPFVPKEQGPGAGGRGPGEDLELSGVAEADAIDAPVVLTVNGKPIPAEFRHAITYAMTDQGQAEARAIDATRPKPSGARVTGDAWDKTLARKAESEVWDSFDPLKDAVDQVREPGMTYRFLSETNHKRRGRRGWETALTKDGSPVKVAGMTLGKMPDAEASKRNAHYRNQGNEQIANAAEQYSETQAKFVRDGGVRGMGPLRPNETLTDNFAHPGATATTGVLVSRGNQGQHESRGE